MRVLRPSQRWSPNFFSAGCWKGHHCERRIRTWSKDQKSGAWVWPRDPAPRKTATAWQPIRAQHVSASPLTQRSAEVASGGLCGRVEGIWQLGLLAGATAGAAGVRASTRERPAAAGWREEPQGLRPKRAEHGARIGPDAAGPRRIRVWNQAVPTCALNSTDLYPGRGLVPTPLYARASFSAWTLCSPRCSGAVSHLNLFRGLIPSSPCAHAWPTSLLLPALISPLFLNLFYMSPSETLSLVPVPPILSPVPTSPCQNTQ